MVRIVAIEAVATGSYVAMLSGQTGWNEDSVVFGSSEELGWKWLISTDKSR